MNIRIIETFPLAIAESAPYNIGVHGKDFGIILWKMDSFVTFWMSKFWFYMF